MSESSLTKKLLIKEGSTFTVLDEPEDFRDSLDGVPESVDIEAEPSEGNADVVLLFCRDREAFEMGLPDATRSLKHDGVLWIAYQKQAAGTDTDINRDIIRDLVEEYGMKAVSLVAIDPVWSAIRLRES